MNCTWIVLPHNKTLATTWTGYCISTPYPVAKEAKGSIVKGLMAPRTQSPKIWQALLS
jgi:hypothetical protein